MTSKFSLLWCWEIILVTLKSTSLWTVLIWLFSLSLLPGNHTCHNNKFYPCQISLWLRSSPFYAAEKLYLSHWNLHPCEQPLYDFSVSPSLRPGNHTYHNNKFNPFEISFMTPKFPLLCCWEITLVTLKSPSLWTASIWLLSFSLLAARKPHLSQ